MIIWLIFAIGGGVGFVAGAIACYLVLIAWANTSTPTSQETRWAPVGFDQAS